MITEENNSITIIAFNYGTAGRFVNGPGICLFNFVKILKNQLPNVSINIFTELKSHNLEKFGLAYSIKKTDLLKESIKNSSIVHHWSGIGDLYYNIIKFANSLNKTVIIGPNVIDTVEYKKERNFLSGLCFHKIITVNEMLRFKISKKHQIPEDLVEILMVGPDFDIWKPSVINNGRILWKGNSRQFVKDIEFGIKVSNKLSKYNFDFLGYPEPYDYFNHINDAKNYKLYFSTSISETMGMALAEQWACGIPSVTHPKIYLHGINYKTGIITNRNIDDYCDAISEIMENNSLYNKLSSGAHDFAKDIFNYGFIKSQYIKILN